MEAICILRNNLCGCDVFVLPKIFAKDIIFVPGNKIGKQLVMSIDSKHLASLVSASSIQLDGTGQAHVLCHL